VTNEPSLSNKWTFHTPAELHALRWVDGHQRNAGVWVGLDERLRVAFGIAAGASTRGNQWDIWVPDGSTRLFLYTDLIRLQNARWEKPLPPVARENRVYDSGTAQLYRLRPRTPFQS
jgi:hypothetical protein